MDIGRKTREDPVDVRKPGVSDFRKKFLAYTYSFLRGGAYAYEKQSNKGATDDNDGDQRIAGHEQDNKCGRS